MTKKILILLLCFIATSAYAGDYLTGFDEETDLPILNEHLRKLDQSVLYGRLRTDDDDDSMGYLSTEVLDIITVGTVSGGTIGGWTLSASGLYGGSGEDYIGLHPGQGIQMGNETFASAEFTVTSQGAIKATSGTIGGWDITASTLESPSDAIVLNDTTSEITVGAIGNTHLQIDGANVHIRSSDYASGALGSGWNVDSNTAEFNNIRARGKFSTSIFEKTSISSVGGNLLVSDSDLLNVDMTAADASTMTILGDTTFAVNDILRMKDGNDDEWFTVTNADSAPTYTVTRDGGSDYAADTNPIWTKGTAVINYGASGEGLIYMTASDTNSPHIDVLTHAGSPWDTTTTRMRMGNVNGFLGAATDLYGIYIGDSDSYLKYDPTNGLQIKGVVTVTGGNATQTFYQDAIPTSIAIGDIWVDTNDSNKLYISYSAGADEIKAGEWVEISTGGGGGVTTFRQSAIPTAVTAGDMWIDTDDDKLYRATSVGDDQITAGEWELYDAAIATGWSHASDTTKIDGGDIYTNTVTATQISVSQLDALAVNTGTLDVDEYINVGSYVTIDGAAEAFKVFSDVITIEAGVNDKLDWIEDASTEVATLTASTTYTPTTLAAHIQVIMRAQGDAETTVVYSSSTKKLTIANATLSTLTLKWSTGTNTATTCGRALGFDITADDSGALTYAADYQAALRVELGKLS